MSWRRAHPLRGFDLVFVPYVRGLFRATFAGLWLRSGDALPRAGGFVAAPNHHSWWDGFVPYLLHHHARDARPFAVMMDDVQLGRFPYFRFGGAFSVDARSTRAALPAIEYAASLARGGACTWIFPEGALRPASAPLAFTSGFAHVARRAQVPIVPVAMRYLFLDRQRPEVFVAIGGAIDARARDATAVTQERVASLLGEIDASLAARGRRDFELVVRGRAGVDDRVALAPR